MITSVSYWSDLILLLFARKVSIRKPGGRTFGSFSWRFGGELEDTLELFGGRKVDAVVAVAQTQAKVDSNYVANDVEEAQGQVMVNFTTYYFYI